VSHNLILISTEDEFPLFQTPTSVTHTALRTGSSATAVDTYEQWLRGLDPHEDDDYVPGWSWDFVTRHIAQINAFLAFAPGAKFFFT
jgi:hypothetical protein